MPKLIDLTGKKFGKLTVIERFSQNDKENKPMWKCKCECGNIIIVRGKGLRNGHTTSCGCYHKSICGKLNFKDITGQTFNFLTAIQYVKSNDKGNAIWLCQCKCGNHVEVSGIDLRNGHVKSCGCISSSGEAKIQSILENNNIIFKKEKTFYTCKFPDTNQMARFDFFINNSYLIEYDGQQHFGIGGWGDIEMNYKKIQFNDNYKNEWCKNNNIPLIRIPYFIYNSLTIEDLMLETSKYRVV